MGRDQSEKEPLLTLQAEGKVFPVFVLIANVLIVFGIVSGTYYWYAILPALEEDPSLHWTYGTTTFALTYATVAEMLGLFFWGPWPDWFSSDVLLAVNGVFMCVMIACQIQSYSAWKIATFILLPCFVKGLMWPSICSITGARMAHVHQDMSFLLSAAGSRLAVVATSTLIGAAMTSLQFSWRQAARCLLFGVATVLALASAIFPRSSDAQSVDALQERRSTLDGDQHENVLSEVGGKWWRLLSSFDAWLAFLTGVASCVCWSLEAYVSVLFKTLYDLTPGEAAGFVGVMPTGMLFGLLFGVLSCSVLGLEWGRVLQLLQVVAGAVAFGALGIWPRMPLNYCTCLLSLGGFGAVVPSYLPCLAFSAASSPEERAFRIGVLWGTGLVVQAGITYTFGKFRENVENIEALATLMYGSTAVSLSVSCLTMAGFYWRSHECSRPASKEQSHA